MGELAKLITFIRNVVRRFLVPNPLSITPFITGEFPMPNGQDIIQFKVVLPLPPAGSDVVGGELTVTIDGTATTIPTTKDQTEVVGLEGPQGSNVLLEYTFLDDAGNRSVSPAQAALVLDDVVPPADPGALSAVITGERTVETPVTEEPVVETPVTEEPVVETPVTEEPVVETPVTEEPVTEEPVVETPVTEEPAPPVETPEDDTPQG